MEEKSKSLAEHRQKLSAMPYSSQGEVLYAMHEISRLVTTWFDSEMSEHGITHPQWWAIMHIFENEGMSQIELSRVLRMGRAATGKLLERLEASKWIERRPDPEDDRIRRVYMHEDSIDLLNQMRLAGIKQFETFMAGVSPQVQEAMVQGVRQIRANAVASTTRTGKAKPKAGA